MKGLAGDLRAITAACDESGHPIDLFRALEPAYLQAADALSRARATCRPLPKLCARRRQPVRRGDSALRQGVRRQQLRDLFVALHDPRSVRRPRRRLQGRRPSTAMCRPHRVRRFRCSIPSAPAIRWKRPTCARESRTACRIPPRWIPPRRADPVQDQVERRQSGGRRRPHPPHRPHRQSRRAVARDPRLEVLLDFNEGCPNVGYLLECLRRVREATSAGFERILYIEQPTARDLRKDRANVMHEAAKLRPVVIDESLTDLETLLLAREMGYRRRAQGVQGADARDADRRREKCGMFLCVQDLTCPGASLIIPPASPPVFPATPASRRMRASSCRRRAPRGRRSSLGLFTIKKGVMHTGQLTGPGRRRTPERMQGRIED